MKLIEAVLQQIKLQEVRNCLYEMGVEDFMESEITCHSHQKGHVRIFRGAELVAKIVKKVKLEIIVEDESAEKIIEAIGSIAKGEDREYCRIAIRPYLEVA
ncbi:MAG: P-II family nitrogen regulator [Geobacteraceae bacterium]